MAPVTLPLEAGASAPAPPAPAGPAIADESELFGVRTLKRATFTLPDSGKTILLEELTPKQYEEVNHAAVSYVDGAPKLDNRLWNARLIASGLRRANGTKMYKNDETWRTLALKIADSWSIVDVQAAAEKAADLSGVSKKARAALEDAVGNDSGESATSAGTGTAG